MKQENKIVGLYPLTKFYLAIVLVVLDIIMPGILSKLVVFVIVNIIAALSDVWKSFIRKVRNSVGVLFVILLFIQTFFYPRGEVIFSFWIFNAKLEGILFALKLGITLMGVGGSLIWFFSVTQEKDFVLALEKSGMSAKASYVVLSTLQMVPVLKKKSQTIMNAQKARGVETEGNLLVRAKVFVPTIIPLVLSSIAGTEERALTLEARGFSSGIKPTHLYDIEKTEADKKEVVIIRSFRYCREGCFMAYIDIQNVTYTYPLTKTPSIADVNLSFERGKFYAILGANGSGKTTLCNIIRGFIPNFFQGEMKGKVIIDGKNLEEYEMGEIASKIGYVFQNPFNQITGARDTVYGEIAYGLENFGVPVAEIKTRVEKIMEITNTTYLQEKNPFELSGGQQQRVALASVLVLEPDILVIDEPTSQLDPQETERVFEIIKTMKKMGKTIILVEHKMELVAEYCDEVVVLHQGKVIRHGDKHDVLSEIELEKFGVMLPLTVYLANELKKHGVRMKDNIITSDEMADQLQKIGKKE